VDRLGGLDDALEEAKKRAHIDGEPRIVRPDTAGDFWTLLRHILPWNSAALPFQNDVSQGLGMGRQVRLDYCIP
jgi:hypothetical protein